MVKQSKSSAGYIHDKNTQYHCADCYKFEPPACTEVRGTILRYGGCNLFVFGRPGTAANLTSITKMSQLEAGYVENRAGFSCKRCEEFDRNNRTCKKVDESSPGPDSGTIHPDACCNNWEKDKVFGNI